MIYCEKCGAEDDDAMDMNWTIGVKNNRVINISCIRCGSHELVSQDMEIYFSKAIIIEEEWEDVVSGG
jgi:predicted nucleic-acid-binding Zn-ribbon protein